MAIEAFLKIETGQDVRHIPLQEGHVTVGQSPTAAIPLVNATDLAPEHFLLSLRADGFWISVAQNVQVPILHEGRAISGELLPWNSSFTAGEHRFQVKRGVAPTASLFKKGAGDAKKPSVLKTVLRFTPHAAVGALYILTVTLGSGGGVLEGEVPEVPSLFGPASAACPAGDPATLGDTYAYEALSRMDRYPFDPEEGVFSVDAHSRSMSCYQEAGDTQNAEMESRRRQLLVERLEQDFRGKAVHVVQAVESENYERALQLNRDLIVMIRHKKNNPYLRWLATLERNLIREMRRIREEEKNKGGLGFSFFGGDD